MDLPTTRHDQKEENFRDSRVSESKSHTTHSQGLVAKISTYVFLAAIFLAPLVFIPSPYAPVDLVKTVIITVLVLVAAIAYVASTLKNRSILVPRYGLAIVSVAIVISVFVSSLLSSNFSKSFMGQGFEIGTATFIFLMFLTSFLASRMVLKNREVVFKIYTVILASFVIIALFHIVRLFAGVGIFSFGIFTDVASSLIGKWYDVASLAALAALISVAGIKFLSIGKGIKRSLVVVLVLSGLVLFLINFTLAWYILAIIFLALGIYEFVSRKTSGDNAKGFFSRISIFTLILFIIAGVCGWNGQAIGNKLYSTYKIQYGEAVLPWQLTLDVTSDTLKESPLFGAGPNRFGFQYLRNKPLEVNQTQFWNSEFTSGFGTLPTFGVTLGLVGIVLWIMYLIFFVRDGIRSLNRASDPLRKFFATSSFFGASFLWIMNIVYIPSHAIVFLTFVLSGICVGITLYESKEKNMEKNVVVGGPSYTRFAPIAASLALVLLVVWLGMYAKKTVAVTYFQSGIKQLNVAKSVPLAENDFKKALLWDKSDIYYQALSEINILKINTLVAALQASSTQNSSATPDQAKIDQVIALTNEAIAYTKSAEKIDPLNYYNHIAEARISEIAASLKVPNAYENARAAYGNALKTNPYNPGIYLSLAQLDASQTKYTDAEQDIGRALQLKQNYTEAVYLLSQIQVANNQLKDAIISANAATQLNPSEPLLFFQLGLLQYNDKDYTNAAIALEKAVALNPQYANAQYFLGLSYVRLGRNEDAIKQFEILAKTNPDNQEVAFILSNLKAGKSPFADVKPPIDNKPEKRKTLPVTEKTTSVTTADATSPTPSVSPKISPKVSPKTTATTQ